MGCAPSIHVSQSTGVVYCREEINSSDTPVGQNIASIKQARNTSLSISEVVSHISVSHRGSFGAATADQRVIARIEKDKHSVSSGKEISTRSYELEPVLSQVQQTPSGMDSTNRREILFGPMKIVESQLEILLVFGKEDIQSEAFMSAANQGGYKIKLATTSESAMEYYLRQQPEIVIIDVRSNLFFEGETLCRNIRAMRPSDNAVVVGVTKALSDAPEPSFYPLAKAGFDRRFIENANTSVCLNELLMLDLTDTTAQCKLRASSCLFSALEHCFDAVEIICTDSEKTEFQYVNPAYEKITGHWRSELQSNAKGSVFSNSEYGKIDSYEGLTKQLNKGKSWEGINIARRKNGEPYVQSMKVVPVIGVTGKVTHNVVVKRDITAIHRDAQAHQLHLELQKSIALSPVEKGLKDQYSDIHSGLVSSDSLLRRQSATGSTNAKMEAPITKVINMLNAVQENSPVNVVQVLEKVIDILRSTELYTPFTTTDAAEEQAQENDLVEGLMTNIRRRHSADSNIKGNVLHRDSLHNQSSLINRMSQITLGAPEVQDALNDDHLWEFDILKLEKITNHRPLYYLGQKIFNRFDVCKFLNISGDVLRNWLQLIESNYHSSNAYHNSTHAADVMHATACFLQKENVKNSLEPIDEITSLIAAVVHDVDHPGFTNTFLCNAGNELAVLYNDIAVLESHHAAMAFKLTAKDSKSNIFKNLEPDDFRTLRQAIIDMIMATEMKQHFEHLSKFDNSLNKPHSLLDDASSMSGGRGTPESTTSHFNPCTPENRTLIRRMIIKCADIANPARPRDACVCWAYRIAEEYFRQTEEEKRRNLPIVMPIFDRNSCNVPRSQVVFVDFFVNNLYSSWDKFAGVPEIVRYISENLVLWKEEADRIEHVRTRKAEDGPTAESGKGT